MNLHLRMLVEHNGSLQSNFFWFSWVARGDTIASIQTSTLVNIICVEDPPELKLIFIWWVPVLVRLSFRTEREIESGNLMMLNRLDVNTFFFFYNCGCLSQFVCTSTNLIGS